MAGSKVSVKLPHTKGLDNSMFLPAYGGGVMRENVFLKKNTLPQAKGSLMEVFEAPSVCVFGGRGGGRGARGRCLSVKEVS